MPKTAEERRRSRVQRAWDYRRKARTLRVALIASGFMAAQAVATTREGRPGDTVDALSVILDLVNGAQC